MVSSGRWAPSSSKPSTGRSHREHLTRDGVRYRRRMRPPTLTVLVLAAALGCRFRTIRPVESFDVEASRDGSSTADAASVADDHAASDAHAPDPTASDAATDLGHGSTPDADPLVSGDASSGCRWVPDPAGPTPLTDGAPTRLLGLVRADDGAWVSLEERDGLYLQRADLDGLRLGAPTPLPPFGGAPLVSAAEGRAGIVGSDERGACRFIPLSAEGVATRAPVTVTERGCADLQPAPGGFSALTSRAGCGAGGSIGYVRFDADGGMIQEVELAARERADLIVRAVRPDGGFVLVWSDCSGRLMARRFTADGAVAADRTEVTALGPDAGRLALVTVGDGLIAAWSRADPAGGGYQVHVAALDADGRPRSTSGPLAAPRSGRSANLALAAWNGTAVLVWTDALRSYGVGVRAMPLTAMGAPAGGVVTLGEFGHDVYPTYPAAIATPGGVMVVFLAARDAAPAPMQVYGSLIRCVPRR